MPDNAARKRLKKMLDRWENEGGRIAADSSIAHESNPASSHQSEDYRSSASHDNPTVDVPATPTKKRKRTLQ